MTATDTVTGADLAKATAALSSTQALDIAQRIGAEVAAPAAADVDSAARFPHETIDALREARLLSALVPTEFGGHGHTVTEAARIVNEIGKHCSSAGMVLAMHHIQVACLSRHGHTPALADLARRVATDQLLLASATTEAGVGGDVRTSRCAVETRADGEFELEKQAMVISYGQYADAIFATARRGPDSSPNDQVLVVCDRPSTDLEPVGDWNVLGFRGTCSLGFRLRAHGSRELIFPVAYGDISSATMLPASHVLWSSLWLGMAASAVNKATKIVQGQARARPDARPPATMRLAELIATYQVLADAVTAGAARMEEAQIRPEVSSSVRFALSMNSLKVTASTMLVDIVGKAMVICGMAGYRDGGELSLGRVLRDAYGSMLMVNNDRILDNNAQLALVHRGF